MVSHEAGFSPAMSRPSHNPVSMEKPPKPAPSNATAVQEPVKQCRRRCWDVTVIGAGPAGAVAAGLLARQGHATLLLDARAFPREKVCGDGLNHDAIRFLEHLGLASAVRKIGRMIPEARIYHAHGASLTVPGPYITIRRKHFDRILACWAADGGALFCLGKATHIFPSLRPCRIVVEGLKNPIMTRYVIVATGAAAGLIKQLGLSHPGAPNAVAARCYVRSAHNQSFLAGYYSRDLLPGYGWVFPVEKDLFNVGVIAFRRNTTRGAVNLKRRFHGFLQCFALARSIVRRANIVGELRAAPLRCGLYHKVPPGADRVLAAGETIGTTLNVTGEGIGKAMHTGQIAAQVIHEALCAPGELDIVGRYRRRLELNFRATYEGFRAAERWLAYPWVCEHIVGRAMKTAYVKRAVAEIITREADPRRFFSPGAVLRSFAGSPPA